MRLPRRSLLSFRDLDAAELRTLLARAATLKQLRARGEATPTLAGRTLGMIFEKPSTRTRVSFEVGMYELGGHAVYLAGQGSQIGRGEPVRDTARVLGGYCDAIVIRTFAQEIVEEMAAYAGVPVINGLTDLLHPCQLLADLFTVAERRGDTALDGAARFAWIGDGNNMANSWIEAAALLGLTLTLACPAGHDPDPAVLARALSTGRGRIEVVRDPRLAARGADVLSTDVWASMGGEPASEQDRAALAHAFAGYAIDEARLADAAADAIVLHCLPAHRGEEITDPVIEGPQSAVWAQAENRLHVQKALLESLLLAPPGRR